MAFAGFTGLIQAESIKDKTSWFFFLYNPEWRHVTFVYIIISDKMVNRNLDLALGVASTKIQVIGAHASTPPINKVKQKQRVRKSFRTIQLFDFRNSGTWKPWKKGPEGAKA